MLEVIACWAPGNADNGGTHRRWANELSQALASSALPSGYPNLLGPDDCEQIPFEYGPNVGRLRDAKRRFDPDNLFLAIPLTI